MKTLIRSFVVLPLLISCGGEEAPAEEENTVQTEEEIVVEEETVEVVNQVDIVSGRVGIFSLGEKVSQLPEELKMRQFTETDVDDEGKEMEHTHNVIFNQLEDVVELIMDQGSGEHHEDRLIEEMIVLSNYYETTEGIAVGSTVEEFSKAYLEANFWYSSMHDWYLCETPKLEGVEFIIDPASVEKKPGGSGNRVAMRIEHFKGGAEIIKIRLH